MRLFQELFSTDVGLLSFAVIAFIPLMAAYIGYYIVRRVREEDTKPRRRG